MYEVPAPSECFEDAPCQNGICGPHVPKRNGTICTDDYPNNICVVAQCFGGVCTQWIYVGNISCDDENNATSFDRCQPDGFCRGIDLCDTTVCPPPSECREEPICFRGVCSYPLSRVNSSCSDGDDRTDFDACTKDGECVGIDLCIENNVICEPKSQCHVAGKCANGVCSPSLPKPDLSPCDDGKEDTAGDVCRDGVCVAIRKFDLILLWFLSKINRYCATHLKLDNAVNLLCTYLRKKKERKKITKQIINQINKIPCRLNRIACYIIEVE